MAIAVFIKGRHPLVVEAAEAIEQFGVIGEPTLLMGADGRLVAQFASGTVEGWTSFTGRLNGGSMPSGK